EILDVHHHGGGEPAGCQDLRNNRIGKQFVSTEVAGGRGSSVAQLDEINSRLVDAIQIGLDQIGIEIPVAIEDALAERAVEGKEPSSAHIGITINHGYCLNRDSAGTSRLPTTTRP